MRLLILEWKEAQDGTIFDVSPPHFLQLLPLVASMEVAQIPNPTYQQCYLYATYNGRMCWQMRKTLENLYFGNIHPTEKSVNKNSRYWKVLMQTNEAYVQVSEMLSDEQVTAFDKYVSLQLSTQAEAELEAFILGFRLSTRLLLDSLVDSDFADAVSSFEWPIGV